MKPNSHSSNRSLVAPLSTGGLAIPASVVVDRVLVSKYKKTELVLREEVHEVVAEVLLLLVLLLLLFAYIVCCTILFLHATRSIQRRVMQKALRRWGSRLCPRDR